MSNQNHNCNKITKSLTKTIIQLCNQSVDHGNWKGLCCNKWKKRTFVRSVFVEDAHCIC